MMITTSGMFMKERKIRLSGTVREVNQQAEGVTSEMHEASQVKYERRESMNFTDRDTPSISEFISIISRDDRQYWSGNERCTRLLPASMQRCNLRLHSQADSSICCSPGNQRCSLLPGPTPTPPIFAYKGSVCR